ncbi:uncharacterized protein F5147DRAFT_679748 [Suillus discolor]|uniref:Uncharacterized protein n=1 Tax=Suillus discolor TaxID=1912936 RepID=A0A9P7FE25_9AGAM|nr:uncharacterized protein F5147DRAFT_679748 [Suillus discolor]KAG2113791.1 hypothetical protein F5147DRAFT_679748 [Suillus discolor]
MLGAVKVDFGGIVSCAMLQSAQPITRHATCTYVDARHLTASPLTRLLFLPAGFCWLACHVSLAHCLSPSVSRPLSLTPLDATQSFNTMRVFGGFAHRAIEDIIWKNYHHFRPLTFGFDACASGLSQTILKSSPNHTGLILSVGLRMQVARDNLRLISGFSLLALAVECVLTNWSVFINTALIMWAFHFSENPAATSITIFSEAPATSASSAATEAEGYGVIIRVATQCVN